MLKEDCTVSSSSKDSGANVNEKLKQIELIQQRTNEVYDNYMKVKETNSEMREAAGTLRYAEATMSTKLLKKDTEMTPRLVRGVVKTKQSPAQVLQSDHEDVGSPALLRVVPVASGAHTGPGGKTSQLKVRPASRVPLKSGVCFSGMPRASDLDASTKSRQSRLKTRLGKTTTKLKVVSASKKKEKAKDEATQASRDLPLLDISLCCRRADTTRNLLAKGNTVDDQHAHNRLETVSLAYSAAQEVPKGTMEVKRGQLFPFAVRSRKRSTKIEHSNESGRENDDYDLAPRRLVYEDQVDAEQPSVNAVLDTAAREEEAERAKEEERARIEQLNMNLIRANNAENQRHGKELIRVRY